MTLVRALLSAAISLAPANAAAHTLEPGVLGGYSSFVHSITEMPAPLFLLSIGLLLGLQRNYEQIWSLPAFAGGILIGLDAVLQNGMLFNPEPPLLVVSLAAGLLAAWGAALPLAALLPSCAVAGFLFGVFSAPGLATWTEAAYYIAGAVLGSLLVVGGSIGLIALARRSVPPWLSIGLRIVGSWLAAISALLVALALR